MLKYICRHLNLLPWTFIIKYTYLCHWEHETTLLPFITFTQKIGKTEVCNVQCVYPYDPYDSDVVVR